MILKETKKKALFISGKIPSHGYIKPIFNKKIILFLNSISIEINKNKKFNIYPDLKAFGFWCRKSNIEKLSKGYKDNLKIGRGIALHITPANVPLNFAYSLAFGLLSGNQNIVRLPSRNFDQSKILCDIIDKLLSKKTFAELNENICLLKYERNDIISSELSKIANARIIWGSDETISLFKNFTTLPRCVDIMFSNRYSSSIINPTSLENLNDRDFSQLLEKFYRDAYIMDQKGCSSPQSVIWFGKGKKRVKDKFWNKLNDYVSSKYEDNLSVTNHKINEIALTAAKSNIFYKAHYQNFKLVRYDFKDKLIEIPYLLGSFGVFS